MLQLYQVWKKDYREIHQACQDVAVYLAEEIGKGRAFDNIMVERLWRTVKYEEVYLKEYLDYFSSRNSLGEYFEFLQQRKETYEYWKENTIGGLL